MENSSGQMEKQYKGQWKNGHQVHTFTSYFLLIS